LSRLSSISTDGREANLTSASDGQRSRYATAEARHGGSTIVHSQAIYRHPPITPYTVYRTRGDTGLQSRTDQTGLLQLIANGAPCSQHSSAVLNPF